MSLCCTCADTQTQAHTRNSRRHTHTHIISVSLPPGWLIDCGCSDTLCRIGILALIGADTNSSRTAGDWGNRSSTGKWLGWQAPPDVGETPRMSLCILTGTRLHRLRSLSEMTICRCVTYATWITSDNRSKRTDRFEDCSEWWGKQCTSETITVTRSPACCRAMLLGLWMTFSYNTSWQPCCQQDIAWKKHLLQSSGRRQQVESLHASTSRVHYSTQRFVAEMHPMCDTK